MQYQSLRVEKKLSLGTLEITFNRPDADNAINLQLINEIHAVLDEVEHDADVRTVVLRGNQKVFCTGMDLKEVSQTELFDIENEKSFARGYLNILKRFSTIPKVLVSICEGKVLAGGVGFVAASDFVIAHPSATFGLSEAIWGLLPANVMPYLIRRVGFQPAYMMTLTTENISSEYAQKICLVDLQSDKPDQDFRRVNKRFSILHTKTIERMKAYFTAMWNINAEVEELAINTLAELKMDPMVQSNIRNYIEHGKLPWE